ncbi:hypothetical protein BDV97DRAFT_395703 [Delphinella strobiligena]|nr:hypothetical protein BDV97DRAFT_395703 [Delphinella strobiligena]
MQLLVLTTAASLLTSAAAFTPASTSGTDALYAKGLVNLAEYEAANLHTSNCSLETGYVRKEWSSLTSTEKKAYISAVLCIQSKPSRSGSFAPGAKSRYDDFVAVHISQTTTIHGTGNFLSWHRYYVHTYEKALREECGYNGYQPYLNWGKYALDLGNAPVFDGSDTSMSGNGEYYNYSGSYIPSSAAPDIFLPAGAGGGCVNSGPFKNFTVNLGPVVPVFDNTPANPQTDGLGYNPRCLRRDLGIYAASIASTDANSTDLITQNTNVGDFQTVMQGDFPSGLLGVHTAGHYWVGGDPGGDLFVSPGDPYFFLHHAQIDRTWWIWQNQDLENRRNAVSGTITMDNEPPSRNTTLEDVLYLGPLGVPNITIGDALSTLDGPFCYIYV